ncbi:phosphoribosylanthranilate isomerase [Fontivita pretiosa]|uniref:phosphoribosylanthranilate isomerase n=1 Tax=Fontivita pretiosa TaxID=2989684 RepID=UPI003D18179D
MRRTRIKFCGITRVQDALAAVELGADAIGLVLHANSPRRICIELAGQILAELPPFVTPVGLFVDPTPRIVLDIAAAVGLGHVQLHGQESPDLLASLPGHLRIIKALRIGPDRTAQELAIWRQAKSVAAILLDSGAGGSGVENDWQLIHSLQQSGHLPDHPRLILAGGLRPDNVADVVRLLRPWAVDVSSGIEESPGIKSAQRMAAFVQAVRAADLS